MKKPQNNNMTSIQQTTSNNNWKLVDNNDDIDIIINNNTYTLNNLMCLLLNKIKQIIIENIGNDFNVIITIPANFNEGQKNRILQYCKQVDLKCNRLLFEPCSAALSYIHYFYINSYDEEVLKRIIVFDFGAGTLDLAIVTCNNLIDDDNLINNN